MIGPATRTSGSCGNTTVPSGTASTSTSTSSRASASRKARSKSGSPSVPRCSARKARSPASKRRCSTRSTTCSSPAATLKPPPNGFSRKLSVKQASLRSRPLFHAAYAIVSS